MLRSQLRLARRVGSDSPVAERRAEAERLTALLLDLPELAAAGCVAAYVARPGEPDPAPLVAALASRGVRVLLPVLRADGDLDWAPAGELAPGAVRAQLLEPVGPRLGVGAVAQADVVLVPALAVSRDGVRLGQGGGSYDRALARAPRALTIALVRRSEVHDHLPSEPHDRPVAYAATPDGLLHLAPLGAPPT